MTQEGREFLELVKRMREAQQRYFRNGKNHVDLRECKALENRVDAGVANLLGEDKERQEEANLFNNS